VAGHPRYAEGIEFDEGNESELANHGISATEAYEVIANGPKWVPNKKNRAGLWKAVGRTNGGRALTLPVTYDEGRSVVRPITGWECTDGEKTRYLRVEHG
jgi:uncharacterized DUF497 family protein